MDLLYLYHDKKRTKIPDPVLANIHDFKNLAGIFHFPNTKALGKFEFKYLMSSTFSQMSYRNFLRGYHLLQMNPMREISQISIFGKRKISTVKSFIFKVTALMKLVIFQSHIFK